LAEVVLCSGFPSQLAVAGLLQAIGLRARTPSGDLSAAFVLLVSMADTIVLLALIWMLVARQRVSPVDALIGSRPLVREGLLGVALVPLILITVGAVMLALRTVAPWLHNVETNPLLSLTSSGLGWLASLGVVVVAGGVREEIQRAFLLRRFQERLGGRAFGVLVTSAAFGLGHTVQGWDAAIVTGLLGALWAMLTLARGGAAAAIASHAAFNTVELLIAGTVMKAAP
jgi:membrane protease YdiL (CAAX protease family)